MSEGPVGKEAVSLELYGKLAVGVKVNGKNITFIGDDV